MQLNIEETVGLLQAVAFIGACEDWSVEELEGFHRELRSAGLSTCEGERIRKPDVFTQRDNDANYKHFN